MKIQENDKKLLIYLVSIFILSIFSIAIYGMYVFYMMLTAIGIAFVIEFAFAKIRKKKMNIANWFVTPLLFVLFLPAKAPIWLVIYGTAFAVLFGKAVFGGDDNYVFNPAMVGLLFVTVSFPQQMTNQWYHTVNGLVGADNSANILYNGGTVNIIQQLMGESAGTIGEVFRLLIILLGLFMIAFKAIDWKVPTFFIGSYFLFSMFGKFAGLNVLDPVQSIFVGTVLLAAFFVAPDEPTIAKYPLGRVLYGIGLGLFTFIIRNFSSFSDGIIFVIVIMNTIAPLIDKIEEPKVSLEEGELA